MLFKNHKNTHTLFQLGPWLTSTWTLQESCLFPDIIICNKGWEPLEVVKGSTVSLHQLMSIWSICREGHFKHPIDFSEWPNPVTQLLYVQDNVSGQEVQISRLAILSLGATRDCERRRADAVMSAMGITDWYDAYFKRHGRPPPDEDLVLDSYPLAFIKEVILKIGSEFYTNFNPNVMNLADQELRGTLLPFGRPGFPVTSGSGLGVGQSLYEDTTDHPSLRTWSVNIDGSVSIPEACVLSPTASNSTHQIRAVFNVATAEGGTEVLDRDLGEFLQCAPKNAKRLALVLNKVCNTPSGIILQSRHPEAATGSDWINIGTWEIRHMQGFPGTVQELDIIVS